MFSLAHTHCFHWLALHSHNLIGLKKKFDWLGEKTTVNNRSKLPNYSLYIRQGDKPVELRSTIQGMRARLRGGRPCAGSATGVGPLLRRYCNFNQRNRYHSAIFDARDGPSRGGYIPWHRQSEPPCQSEPGDTAVPIRTPGYSPCQSEPRDTARANQNPGIHPF